MKYYIIAILYISENISINYILNFLGQSSLRVAQTCTNKAFKISELRQLFVRSIYTGENTSRLNQDATYLRRERTRLNGQFVRDQSKSRLK